MDLVSLHTTAERQFVDHLRAVRDDQWTARTPCTEWDVRALVNHMVYEYLWVPELLGGATIAEVGDKFDGDVLGSDPIRTWSSVSRAAHEAIASTPMDKAVNVSWGQISAGEYIGQFVTDVAVHGWDLARGIGADDTIDPVMVDALLPGIEENADSIAGSGSFGHPVDVPADADDQTRMLALLGRRR
ncbi:MAG: hypothetical protein QOG52_1349 [Frankiaceae bacterium]|jgi:uncharacterized protein (TIGR03086 family)|nr:hypothetical protein [Frankiaceae bacterium]